MEPVRLPTKVDEAHQFLLWSSDEMIPLLTLFIIGILLEQALLFTAIGFFLTSIYKKYKNSRPDGYLLHYLYWVGLVPSKSKTMVNPFIKRFIP
jgi:conjugal transfer pilus assembly protein TraL